MFWSRNKKINIQVHLLIWRPVLIRNWVHLVNTYHFCCEFGIGILNWVWLFMSNFFFIWVFQNFSFEHWIHEDIFRSTYHLILQGYRLTFFRQEQDGPLKQNGWEPSPKVRGPGFGRKLNSFQHHCQAFALLIMSSKSVFLWNQLNENL